MGWLKKAGSIALQAVQIAAGVTPVVKLMAPQSVPVVERVEDTMLKVRDAVLAAEVAGQAWGKPGPERVEVAAALTAQAILASALVAGREVADPTLFAQGCNEVASGMAKVLNSLKSDA